ncbi:hypothetical protein [Sinomicrobium weinanense]|uniref:HEPN domain-containing protein n=1 Tax=Sinomicrobium weinanense TaxID=2842200 RepID=A0A926JVE0_9FLAO|nr:hypothetical protein [Sinomicrobium weinanense]MBC9798283.1 hypothetical protein [Sinomicrobium weinanense]MBU3125093.1 hypothetical protein [Sinomicrobium weinanense]
MNYKTDIDEKEIVEKLTKLLEVQYIYLSATGNKDYSKPVWIVILKGNRTGLTTELSAMVAKIFQEETNALYRIFSFEYAQEQLKDKNLFFIHGCHPSNLIYKSDEIDTGLKVPAISEETREEIELDFEDELTRVSALMDGAAFYMGKENFPLAALLLHQYMEISFRNAELTMLGRERKSHSIKEHQNYIRAFVPELGRIFNMDQEEDVELLKLLDDAYMATRYHKNYHITKLQLKTISEKVRHLMGIIGDLYREKLEDCKGKTSQPASTKEKSVISPSWSPQDNLKIKERIERLMEMKLHKLSPNSDKLYYKTDFLVNGPADMLYDIAGIMKACIIALEYADGRFNSLIPQPHINIQTALKHALQLLPFEEVECLEKIIEEYMMPVKNEAAATTEN